MSLTLSGHPRDFRSNHDLAEAKRHEDRLPQIIEIAERDLAPAEPREIADELEALLSRYHESYITGVDQTAMRKRHLREWIDDLSDFPIDIVRLACRNWRRNDKRGFPPRASGQLMASIDDVLKARRRIYTRAQGALIALKRHSEANRIVPKEPTDNEQCRIESLVSDAAKGSSVRGLPNRRKREDQLAQIRNNAE